MQSNGPRRFVIHPSILDLVQRIAAICTTTPLDEVVALRAACFAKVRSYPVESYLRTVPDQVLARSRYDAVVAFSAARGSRRDG